MASDGPRLSAQRPTIYLGSRGAQHRSRVNLREGAHHSGNWGGLLANPAVILSNAIANMVAREGRIKFDMLKPPADLERVRAALADVEDRAEGGGTGVSKTGARRACPARKRSTAGIRWKCWRFRRGISRSRPMRSREGERGAAGPLRDRHRMRGGDRWRASASRHERLSVVEVTGEKLFGASRPGWTSVDGLGREIDPAHDRQGAGNAAQPRRLAAERRVCRDPRPADGLGAAFLSRLLAASPNEHILLPVTEGTRHHGGPVLGSRRDAARAIAGAMVRVAEYLS